MTTRIITICANCEQALKYVSVHEGDTVRFSHGMCPSCLEPYEDELRRIRQEKEGKND